MRTIYKPLIEERYRMKDYEILKSIETITPDNLFLSYIIDRVQDDNYRGIQCSQHNRLTFNYFKSLLQIIYDVAGTQVFSIHVGDDNGERQANATDYYKIVDAIKRVSGKGTINSVKKNTFPDIARAGFLYRYNKHGERISESLSIGEGKTTQPRDTVYQVQLSQQGINFVRAKSEFERRKYYTDLVDTLTKNAATDLVELLSTDERFDNISIDEFMYILSDDRANVRYNDKLLYLAEYRRLTQEQQDKLTELLKLYCAPNRNIGTKINARDYYNWKNESLQIFGLLSNSTYFKVVEEQLLLNNGEYGLFLKKAERSQKPKIEYFRYHNIKKEPGYELHHIVPFNKALTQQEAQWIDDKRNMIYLSTEKHAEFTTTRNINIRTSYTQPNFSFLPIDSINGIINVDLRRGEALLSTERVPEMIEYNKRLLKKFYGVS